MRFIVMTQSMSQRFSKAILAAQIIRIPHIEWGIEYYVTGDRAFSFKIYVRLSYA